MEELRNLYHRPYDGTPSRGDRADDEPVLGMALTGTGREVVLRERDLEAPRPPEDAPDPGALRIDPCGPGPTETCAPHDFHPAEDIAPGIAGAVDRCLDESGAEGAFIRLLMERVPARGHAFWLIGGAVRDLVDVGPAARPNDLDFAGTLPPTALLREIEDRYVLAGLGDYRPRLSPDSLVVHLSRPAQKGPRILEYKALAVTDFRFSAWGGGLADDVTSRDLTVNSLYYDHGRRVLADPTGVGITHVRSRPRVLASRNAERPAARTAGVLLRFLKFAVRYPEADLTELREWAAALPGDLVGRLSDQDWPALRYAWHKNVPEAGRERAVELAGHLGPAAGALVDRLTRARTAAGTTAAAPRTTGTAKEGRE
ncbi:hypothetical protein [Streptomyces vinaceus]|uniref:hypothetical protein n=1 Tax=Streptomyces vinaceus TaxID=1960 RepID=UPI0036CE43C6